MIELVRVDSTREGATWSQTTSSIRYTLRRFGSHCSKQKPYPPGATPPRPSIAARSIAYSCALGTLSGVSRASPRRGTIGPWSSSASRFFWCAAMTARSGRSPTRAVIAARKWRAAPEIVSQVRVSLSRLDVRSGGALAAAREACRAPKRFDRGALRSRAGPPRDLGRVDVRHLRSRHPEHSRLGGRPRQKSRAHTTWRSCAAFAISRIRGSPSTGKSGWRTHRRTFMSPPSTVRRSASSKCSTGRRRRAASIPT